MVSQSLPPFYAHPSVNPKGSLHFTLLLLPNLAQTLLNYYGVTNTPPTRLLAADCTCVIVSHFLSNLRQVNTMERPLLRAHACAELAIRLVDRREYGRIASLRLRSPSQVDDVYGSDLPGNDPNKSDADGARGRQRGGSEGRHRAR
ncbi:hypothetical protein SCP_0805580 [Sparassis crispa]|uniref:Uncharacterized protein n=1 Tax=Sparassis crispa TaxID=139825 RepID=A0A401GW91_9APHY|nr:hypothetical protein SCP_0805580 [Sparassis crispa]GBE86034.1 hypothetical protein SCP_0805580 [Sparassis crispa]